MDNLPNAQPKPKHRLTPLRIFRDVMSFGAIFILCLFAPSLLGKFVGHGWGLLAAVADILGWFYLNQKFFKKAATSTRLIWLIVLLGIIVTALIEGEHVFR